MTWGGSRRRRGCGQRRGEEGWREKTRGGAKGSGSCIESTWLPCGVTSSSDQGHPPFSPSSTPGPTDMPIPAQKGKHRRATRKQVVFYSFLSLLRRDHNTENGSPAHGGTVWSVSTRTRGAGGAGPAFPLSSPPGTTCCSPAAGLARALPAP